MNQSDMRSVIADKSNRSLRRVTQNLEPRETNKPHLAKPGLKGEHHGRSRHPS